MVAELISVGTEILLGNIVNTNSNYLAKKCAEIGISVYYQITVGDNEQRLIDAVKTARSRSDLIIITGGLGPTQDDITKEAVAKAIGRDLVMDEHSKEKIQTYFNERKQGSITPSNWKQALKIEGCQVIDNDNGTAPGYIVEDREAIIMILPGPPNEMIPMFENSMYPYLAKLDDKVFYSKMVKICGIGESQAEEAIIDLIEKQSNPTIAPYAKAGEVHFRVTASANSIEEAQQMMEPIIGELQRRFQDNIYTLEENESLETVVISLLSRHGLTVTTAESCTGGLISSQLVNVPGASDVLNEAIITYSNGAKMKYLGVKEETLTEYGAVSEQTAGEMAIGAANLTKSDTAIAATGIAGPGGGTKEKPVGLVYIASYIKGKVKVKELRLKGDRTKIRRLTATYALDLLRREILNYLNENP
ncbi:MAG: competence/damage-inducible protein A [Clostridiales bacterium]|nr:competence/damage-inducible protein A [Clostridiales bacterium]